MRSCLFLLVFWSWGAYAREADVHWTELERLPQTEVPATVPGRNFRLDEAAAMRFLVSLPSAPAEGLVYRLPAADSGWYELRIWETPVMEDGLAAKYPEIRTFSAYAADRPHVTAKISVTPLGLHAMIFDGPRTTFIEPATAAGGRFYRVCFKSDYPADPQPLSCLYDGDNEHAGSLSLLSPVTGGGAEPVRLVHGSIRREYRLALSCTGEYAVRVAGANPSKAAVLSRMAITLNRVNGVYERELAVTMKLVAGTDTLIFLDGTTDPFTNNNGYTLMQENQELTDLRIGPGNYDIGHVFSTGGGGVAFLAGVCIDDRKARGVTGSANPQGDPYDIDYVAHEIGHQFGANHTFNTRAGSCGGNRFGPEAYEPGSGSTIMAYPGLCAPDNLQPQVSVYFHSVSLRQMAAFITAGGNCARNETVSASIPEAPPFAAAYHIPRLTPFELSAPGPDDAAYPLAYGWEEWDLSSTEFSWNQSRLTAPLFRSFDPVEAPGRIFPALSRLVGNTFSYLGEKLPDTGRTLNFRRITRAVHEGWGLIDFPDDMVTLHVSATQGPFRVTAPEGATATWYGATTGSLIWEVEGTDAPPVSCGFVDAYLSVDGGYTYPYLVAAGLPNIGNATVQVPNVYTTNRARIKLKARGNVFFDISNEDFTIVHDERHPVPPADVREYTPAAGAGVKVYPVPAADRLHIMAEEGGYNVLLYDPSGRLVRRADCGEAACRINVTGLAGGVYYLRVLFPRTGLGAGRTVLVAP